MLKSSLLPILILFFTNLNAQKNNNPELNTRQIWLSYMDKVCRPVIQNLSDDVLKEKMPVVLSNRIDNPNHRTKTAYLEAFSRTLCGISPWLNSDGGSKDEIILRNQYRIWSLKAIANATDPKAKDYMLWEGGQPLVDASFFALALIRCPWLWEHLDTITKRNVVTALLSTRPTIPVYTNWILFTGMVEAFFCKYGYEFDAVRIEYGLREFIEHWYTGDGFYSDGMHFHLDFYNSYVIQPYLLDILEAVKDRTPAFNWALPKLNPVVQRYAEIQERLINADGSFPVIGRSIVYRGGAFHQLADIVLLDKLPQSLKPEQVRCALTAVIKKTLNAPSAFTKEGWLNIGLYGSQPDLADFYINSGSLYLCSTIFLPLGLPETDPFWSFPDKPWTAVKVWSGQDVPADHALDIH